VSRPNTALHLTAYSLRFATLCSGFRQQVSLGVRQQNYFFYNSEGVP
jgi:hypothetical protein